MARPGFASRLWEDILMEPDTHAKNCAISPAESVFIIKTLSVICFKYEVSALEPAAQAIILAAFRDLIFSAAWLKASISVGEPSVRINTRGRQSPFWVSVVLRTSLLTQSMRTFNAPPRAVAPPAEISGSLNCISSVSYTHLTLPTKRIV